MNIDWNSLALVAITTVVAAVAIIGIFSLGVIALTSGNRGDVSGDRGGADVGTGVVGQPNPMARVAGYACVGIAGLLAIYGLYLIIPQFH